MVLQVGQRLALRQLVGIFLQMPKPRVIVLPIHITGLAVVGSSCDSLSMTTTVDQKHRAVTPFKPGDVLEIEQQSPDVVILKRTKQAASARPKLVRRNRRLIFVGEATTTDEVKRILED